jgi:TolA-binding protein
VTALADRFLSDGELEHAERLVRVMLSNPKSFPRAPAYLARLGTQLMRDRQAKKGRAYLGYLLERFPSAPEVAIAQELLR